MTEREQALLELVRKLRSFLDDTIASGFIEDSPSDERWNAIRVDLIESIDAALADHAAPQVSLTRKDASGTVDVDSRKVEPATSPFSTPAGAAPASVSPQAPTAVNLSCTFGEGVGQGGTAAGADWVRVQREKVMLVHGLRDAVLCIKKGIDWGCPLCEGMNEHKHDCIIEEVARFILSAAPRPDTGEGGIKVSKKLTDQEIRVIRSHFNPSTTQFHAICDELLFLRREKQDNYCWLIEHGDQSHGIYYWTALTGGSNSWEKESEKAIRFSRKIDAENEAMRFFTTFTNWKVVEHCFNGDMEVARQDKP